MAPLNLTIESSKISKTCDCNGQCCKSRMRLLTLNLYRLCLSDTAASVMISKWGGGYKSRDRQGWFGDLSHCMRLHENRSNHHKLHGAGMGTPIMGKLMPHSLFSMIVGRALREVDLLRLSDLECLC